MASQQGENNVASGPTLERLGHDLRKAPPYANVVGDEYIPIVSPVGFEARKTEGRITPDELSALASVYTPIGGGLAAPAQFKLASTVDLVVDFDAEGDGSNEHTNIQAAVDTQRKVLVSGADGRIFKTSSPILMPDSGALIGESRKLSIIRNTSGFTGGALIRGASRDDDAPGVNEEGVVIQDLCISVKTVTNTIGLDITGFRKALISGIYFDGPGPTVAGSIALRLSDRNPAGNSDKSTFFNLIQNITADGTGWETFLKNENHEGNCNTNSLIQFNSYSAIGADFGTQIQGNSFLMMTGYLFGTNVSNGGANVAWKGTRPTGLQTIGVSHEGHGDGDGFLTDAQARLSFNLGAYFTGTTPAQFENFSRRKASSSPGDTAAAPIAPTQGTGFRGVAYLKIASGNTLTAGVSTWAYTFLTSGEYASAHFRIDVVSGLPIVPVQFMGALAGGTTSTFTLSAAVTADRVLAADLVLRVTAENDY